jgi:hypothetical protein
LRRNVRDRPLEDFQQRLLHALAGHVSGNRGVFVFAADLVDLIDVDDSVLSSFDIPFDAGAVSK